MKKDKDLFKTQRQKRAKKEETSQNVVIYTRVSTKEQFETNASLDTQKRICEDFAKKNGFNVIKLFGDTYESAKTDKSRKQFQAMLDFVKKHKKDLHGIIVYDYSRFSRSEENLLLVFELKKLGVEVLSATQATDTQSPSGRLSRAVQLVLANFDNEQKSERTKAGIVEKLRQGIWATKLPKGYKKNQETRTIEIDANGELIREAFHLIAAGDTITSVKRKMDRKGLKLDIRRWSDIFNNPFYAGLIVHKLLEHEPIKGKHPQIVSEELWKQVKRNRSGKEVVITNQHGSVFFPLKGFITCSCGRKFTGYQAKKKSKPNGEFFYYKCNNPQCYTNVSAKTAEKEFVNFLSELTLNRSLHGLFKKQLKATYLDYQKETIAKKRELELTIKDFDEKRLKLTDKFLYHDLEKEIYQEHKRLLEEGKAAAIYELNFLQVELSNPTEFIDFAMYIAVNLNEMWEKLKSKSRKGYRI
ncbi:recombinase family protein [Pontibacter pudoricolor]|uniref:recombinase family protein n=1 Tax=Pontibacter pudoricolor TaxID=2694930 RepID=UPI001390BABE|nr:recombinase family protein [Pontibacter pudoricolor]